ncbi:MAG: hypothetical protein HYV97_08535 [Bdellovibrio sp.]|nr:hypothetical protein [Bdellovibrio sp.]
MKVKILFISLLLSLIGAAILLILWAPYHFYKTAVTDGIRSEYLNLGSLPEPLYNGKAEILGPIVQLSDSHVEQKLWQLFHFSDFQIPLPLHHPEVNFYPWIEEGEGRPLIGGRFVDQSQVEVFTFTLLGGTPFTLRADKEKLFSLPAVKQLIFRRSAVQIWGDLFQKSIKNDLADMAPWHYLTRGPTHSLDEMFYNLFLLHMRPVLMRQYQVEGLKYLASNKIGIVQVYDIDERYTSEYIFLFVNGIVYKIRLRIKKNNALGRSIRDVFLYNLSFEESSVDSSEKIYAAFRNLPYRTRVEQEGMVYLYAAWTHVTDRVEFLREMIQFLERGPEKLRHLRPLYEYAYRRFGDLLSKDSDANVKLNRKMQEELEKEIESAKINSPNMDSDGRDLLHGREREEYLLKKAKFNKVDTDSEEKRLDR